MKAKFLLGLAWLQGLGIKPLQQAASCLIGFLFILSILVNACTFFGADSGEDSLADSEEAWEEGDPQDNEGNHESEPDSKGDDDFPHPKAATAWDTQALLLSAKLPAAEDLKQCYTDITLLAKEAANAENLLKAKERTQEKIEKNTLLYHWCFYSLMRQLDSEITGLGATNQEKIELFLEKMRQLWLLARSLDSLQGGGERYFRYLQERYLALSQQFFGRSLTAISPPLDQLPRPNKEEKDEASDDSSSN